MLTFSIVAFVLSASGTDYDRYVLDTHLTEAACEEWPVSPDSPPEVFAPGTIFWCVAE